MASHHPSPTSKLLTTMLVGGAATVAGIAAVRTVVRARRYMEVAGRVCLITGGSRGLGLEIARQLGQQGARVAIVARDEDELFEAREQLDRDGVNAFTITADITDPEQCRHIVDQVESSVGPVDVLFNNAGIIAVGPFETQGRGEFAEAFATHVGGPLELIRAVLPTFKRRGSGRIVNISSIGGKVPVPQLSAYVASKFALTGLSETLRAELAPKGIYVTLIVPGLMRTGSPWHARFTGDAAADFAWFATSDNTPGLAIAARRMARRIIDAMQHGDAELVTPFNAKFASATHGLLGGVSTEIASLIARLLPRGRAEGMVTGREADRGQLPQPVKREQARNAAKFNEGEQPAGG